MTSEHDKNLFTVRKSDSVTSRLYLDKLDVILQLCAQNFDLRTYKSWKVIVIRPNIVQLVTSALFPKQS